MAITKTTRTPNKKTNKKTPVFSTQNGTLNNSKRTNPIKPAFGLLKLFLGDFYSLSTRRCINPDEFFINKKEKLVKTLFKFEGFEVNLEYKISSLTISKLKKHKAYIRFVITKDGNILMKIVKI